MTENEFKLYLALGLCAPGVWGGNAEPVAYLYNGVRLPKLPEWDRERYPYASISGNIMVSINKFTRHFWAYTEPVIATGQSATNMLVVPKPCLRWKLEDGAWVEYPFDGDKSNDNATVGLWANYDVYYTDDSYAGETFGFEPGSLYLSASDPVPVYE